MKDHRVPIEGIVPVLFTGLLMLFLVLSLRTTKQADWCAALLALAGTVVLFKAPPQRATLDRPTRYAAIGLLVWPAYQLIALTVWHGPWPMAVDLWYGPLALLVVFALRQIRVRPEFLFGAIALGAIAVLLVALNQVFIKDEPRAFGHWYPISFGNWSAVLGGTSLLGLLLPARRAGLACLFAGGAAAGIGASILSGSRGGWPVIPMYAAIFGLAWWRAGRNWRVPLVSLCLIAAVSVPFGMRVLQRLESAVQDVSLLRQDASNTSLGMRLEMWRVAAGVFVAHPMTGIGPAGMTKALKAEVEARRLPADYLQFAHAHNDLLDAAATGGLPKIAVLSAFYACWCLAFRRWGPGLNVPRLAGLCLVTALAIFGLTEAMMVHRISDRLIPMLLGCLFALHWQTRDSSDSTPQFG